MRFDIHIFKIACSCLHNVHTYIQSYIIAESDCIKLYWFTAKQVEQINWNQIKKIIKKCCLFMMRALVKSSLHRYVSDINYNDYICPRLFPYWDLAITDVRCSCNCVTYEMNRIWIWNWWRVIVGFSLPHVIAYTHNDTRRQKTVQPKL